MDINNINKLIIDAKIFYNEGLYKKALDNLLLIYNNNIIEYNILRLIVDIYLIFDNYIEALKYININISYFHLEEDYKYKYKIIKKVKNKKLLQEFLTELPNDNKYNDIKIELNNLYNSNLSTILTTTDVVFINDILDHYLNNDYYNKLPQYASLINDNPNNIISDIKKEYRYFCFNFIDIIKNIKLPTIPKESVNEAVLIEFRQMPHLEFLIRNSIYKLGNNWSQTIICGELNYDYIAKMCNQISPNIKIIKLNYNNLSINNYNELLASTEFWNLFIGEKILIYQEDTCIFGNNINDFIQWDYIGAPWIKDDNNNSLHVGNGGFSLRSKKCMIDVINKINIKNAQYNKSYSDIPPEDVYFSKVMIDYNLGKVADFDNAYKFSSEYYTNLYSFGGHCFYIYFKNWKKLMFERVIYDYIN